MAVGYDDTQQSSSCGTRGAPLGDAGYFTIPYAYLTAHNLASDF
jgi:hypothetical protein